MVSGSYKGASINVNDWILVGALAVGGYFLYKSLVKPTAEVTGAVGDIAGSSAETFDRGAEAVGSFFDVWDTAFDKLKGAVEGIGGGAKGVDYTGGSSGMSTQQIIDAGGVYGLSGQDIVTNIEATARHSRTTSPTKAVAVIPVYDKVSGTGVNAAGYGYSSAFDLGARGTGTGISATTTKNTAATDIFTKKPYS